MSFDDQMSNHDPNEGDDMVKIISLKKLLIMQQKILFTIKEMLTTVRDLARAMTSREGSKINSHLLFDEDRVICYKKYFPLIEKTFFLHFLSFKSPLKNFVKIIQTNMKKYKIF